MFDHREFSFLFSSTVYSGEMSVNIVNLSAISEIYIYVLIAPASLRLSESEKKMERRWLMINGLWVSDILTTTLRLGTNKYAGSAIKQFLHTFFHDDVLWSL